MFFDRILEILGQLYQDFMIATPKILGAFIIFILGWIIAKIIAGIVKKVLKSLQIDKLAERLNDIDFV